MGLMDFLGTQISKANNKYESAQLESEDWDVDRLVDSLGRCSNIMQAAGYCNTLKQKCEELDDWELKDTFDRAWDRKNAKACNAMMSVMEDRGLAHFDSEGKMHKAY